MCLFRCGPRNRAAAARCGRGRCELPAILRITPLARITSDCDFLAAGPPISAGEWLRAHPATVVPAILRYDFCAAKLLIQEPRLRKGMSAEKNQI